MELRRSKYLVSRALNEVSSKIDLVLSFDCVRRGKFL